jgi:hypothetical protein
MVRPRTWDVSLDGWDHVVTYTPRRSADEMSFFAVDGRTITVHWKSERGSSGASLARADFNLAGHEGAFHWQFPQRPRGGFSVSFLVKFVLALIPPGNWSIDPDDDQKPYVEAEVWLTVDHTIVAARGEAPPIPAAPKPHGWR